MTILQPSGLFLLSDVKRQINASLIVDHSLNYIPQKNLMLNVEHCSKLYLYLAAMTYNQVHYFRVNHLADFTQNGHTKIPVG